MKFYEKHFGLKQTRYRDIPEVPHALYAKSEAAPSMTPLMWPVYLI